jgi:hypothetical protein
VTADRSRTLSALITNCTLAVGLGAMGYWLCYESPVAYVHFVSNDGWARFATFVAYLAAAVGFLWLVARDPSYRRIGVVGLAVATLFAAGRSIEWGRPTVPPAPASRSELTKLDVVPPARGHALAGPGILFFAVIVPRLSRVSERLANLYERFGVPVVPGRVLPLFLLAALIPYSEAVSTLPDSWVLMNLSLGTALAVMAVDLLVRSQGGARDGATMVALSTVAVVVTTWVAAVPLVQRVGLSSLRSDLNDYAAHRFPAEGMYRQAESVFRHLQSHPDVQQDDTVLNRAIVYRPPVRPRCGSRAGAPERARR